MKFTYQELQDKEGDKVGQFRGYPVYCASIYGYLYEYSHEGNAYLIYNDNNVLVVEEKVIGCIKANGAIDYFASPVDYNKYLEAKSLLPDLKKQNQRTEVKVEPSKNMVETSQIPTYTQTPAPVDFDINKLTMDINLSSSELVESLLNSVFEN